MDGKTRSCNNLIVSRDCEPTRLAAQQIGSAYERLWPLMRGTVRQSSPSPVSVCSPHAAGRRLAGESS
jgi:hypothetical protein